MQRIVTTACAALFMATACAPNAAESPAAPPAPVASAPEIKLPVSINAAMVALVDHASEPLWVDAYVPPTTEDRWKEAEYNAYQIAVAGKLVQLEGTGPKDATWIKDPTWIANAEEMSAAGMDALAAAQGKDVGALDKAGDRLVTVCESCHKAFKPDLPTMGLYKSPNYPPRTE